MKLISRMLAVLCAIAFVLAAPAALLAFQIDRGLLNAPVYQSALERAEFYDQLPSLIASQLRADADEGFAGATDAQLATLARTLAPAEVLRPVIDDAITQVVAYGRGERDSVAISVATLKTELTTRFPEAILAAVADRPECENGDSFNQSLACRPRAEDMDAFNTRAREAATEAWARLPDAMTYPRDPDAIPRQALEARRWLVMAIDYGPWVAAGLLALIALFTVRGARGLMLWWGVPLALGGMIALGGWSLIDMHLTQAFDSIWMQARPNDPGARLATPIVELVLREFAAALLASAGIMAGVGAAMSVAGLGLRRRDAD